MSDCDKSKIPAIFSKVITKLVENGITDKLPEGKYTK